MTMDRTLKVSGGLIKVRSVLTRAERIAMMVEDGTFEPGARSPLGLPKTKVRHSKAGTKSKKAEETPAEGAAPAAAAPAAAAGKKTAKAAKSGK